MITLPGPGTRTCCVCGKTFPIVRAHVYQVRETLSVSQLFSVTQRTYDAIDCPTCSCQNRLGVRYPKVKELVEVNDDD